MTVQISPGFVAEEEEEEEGAWVAGAVPGCVAGGGMLTTISRSSFRSQPGRSLQLISCRNGALFLSWVLFPAPLAQIFGDGFGVPSLSLLRGWDRLCLPTRLFFSEGNVAKLGIAFVK